MATKDCDKRRASRVKFMAQTAESISRFTDDLGVLVANARTLNSVILYELSRGNYSNTLKHLDTGLKQLSGVDKKEIKQLRAVIYTNLARTYSLLGDDVAAGAAFAQADELWESNSFGAVEKRMKLLGQASKYESVGSILEAESAYRKLLEFEFNDLDMSSTATDEAVVRAQHSQLLLHQERWVEAELEARKSVQRYTREPGHINELDIRANLAQPLTMLARALYQQDRLEDAEYVARMGLYAHAQDCSWPDSVAYANSRLILARVLAAQGGWQDVMAVFDEAKEQLKDDVQAFKRLYAASAEFGLALVYAGRTTKGTTHLTGLLQLYQRRYGAMSYEVGLARGYLGITHAQTGNTPEALKEFVAAREVLMPRRGSPEQQGREVRLVLEAYARFLVKHRSSLSAKIDVVGELFELASVLQAGTVQDALIASGSRAAIRDERMADVDRREQDTTQQIETLLSRLTELEGGPPARCNQKP